MINLLNTPRAVFAVALIVLWAVTLIGARMRTRVAKDLADDFRQDFNVIFGASPTLLGLTIGFNSSTAMTRYEQFHRAWA
jgi:hypothetical protein